MTQAQAGKTLAVDEIIDNISEMAGKYLTFWIDKQLFGVPIKDVVQIVGMQEITEIPEFPAYAKGIIDLRGSVIPLIDVRLRFGIADMDYNERTCIIVTSIYGKEIGFIVDEVDEVANIDEQQISPPPQLSGGGQSAYLTGIGRQEGKVVLLVDAAKMLDDDVVENLINVGGRDNV